MSRRIHRWTDEEIGVLIDRLDGPVRDIAEELGRSVESVKAMKAKVASGWSPKEMPWTDDENLFIIESPNLTAKELAAQLGRTSRAIEAQRKRLSLMPLSGQRSPFAIGRRHLVAKTCRKCGRLLAGRFFRFHSTKREWSSRCALCLNEQNLDYRRGKPETASTAREFQDRMQKLTTPAPRNNLPWLDADMAILADPDLTMLEKALKLGRSYAATSAACSLNGFTSKLGLGDPERDQWKIDNPNAKEYTL